ncbi:MAG: polyphosphate polymerase domain-containing protein [Lachnospiraceae bacterium]|nr:polyphosphate polymerase domain-containing protein [Lachnospiraceae bacterium]MBR1523377.1 polyphosphate polymerase domain-containing protein [Lachnospiraceae bacterium]
MFDEKKHYRHEYKYIEPELRLKAAELRLDTFMKKDSHTGDKGFYSIRSLYFDDYFDSFLMENIDGVDEREKWRIRIYDRSSDFISLERKSRKADLISKDSCRISKDTFAKIMDGTVRVEDDNPPLLNVFIVTIRTKALHPAVIVEYERTPFAAKEGNTRITFDRNIRSSSELDALLADRELASRPVLETGQNLLEVKYDAFLPNHFQHAIETGHMHRETFSKYYLSRKFNYTGTSATGHYVGRLLRVH